jgi:hypothetical protein
MVELPVGYAPALENQFDPAHAEWLHAKYGDDGQILGSVDITPMTRFNVVEGSMGAGGFTVQHGGYNAGNMDVSAERLFTAPGSSRSEYTVGLYKLTPPDPYLEGAWFQPLSL